MLLFANLFLSCWMITIEILVLDRLYWRKNHNFLGFGELLPILIRIRFSTDDRKCYLGKTICRVLF